MRSPHFLLTGASLATIATLVGVSAQPARADGFQGTPTIALGSVTFDRTPPTSETITINSARATINWAPYDVNGTGDVNFLPAGNSVNFVAGSSGAGGYTVLNRIVPVDPTRRVNMDGLVASAAGGNLWFYAPGGILLGNNAVFNVGSLLLTAGDPLIDANGNFLVGNRISVAAALGSSAGITLNPGARVSSRGAGSYVIAVAPRIDQGGTINVNGSAVLVAAQAVDFTYNAGLFDITVTQGTDAANPFGHSGTTTGPASIGSGDYHRIYMVAVPKNTAMTMFVQAGGQIGFDIAGSADTDGNAVVLSSGYNVRGVVNGDPFAATAVNGTLAALNIDSGSYTSTLSGRASSDLGVLSSTGNASFSSDVSVRSDVNAYIAARNGRTTSIAGNASVSAAADMISTTDGANRTAGTASVYAQTNGILTVAGNVIVSAVGTGNGNITGFGATGNGAGGNASLAAATGARISIAGNVTVDASGHASEVSSAGTNGGSGRGGTGGAFANGGNLTIGGSFTGLAIGAGGDNLGGGDFVAGAGTGGRIDVDADTSGTLLSIGGPIMINVGGFGGAGVASGTTGGTGQGGIGQFGAGSGTATTNGDVTIFARGAGGAARASGSGGEGVGGQGLVRIFGNGGLLTINGLVDLEADGSGGSGDNAAGTGGTATGGMAMLDANFGAVRTTGASGTLVLTALATGGSGAIGGAGAGGTAQIGFTNGSVTTTYATTLSSRGTGGTGSNGPGGAATGGTSQIALFGGGASSANFGGSVSISADAIAGTASGLTGSGGTARGGTAKLIADQGGTLSLSGALLLQAVAAGAQGAVGGNATGGQVLVEAQRGTINIGGASSVLATASAGSATGLLGGAGGTGTGGSINLDAFNSAGNPSTLAMQSVIIDARGTGGDGGRGSDGGAGGRGGDGSGGIGNGIAFAKNGQFTATNVAINIEGRAGAGGAGGDASIAGAGGRGGDAFGGFSNFGTASGSAGTVLAGYNRTSSVVIDANAFGGNGGAGGAGSAGGGGGSGGSATTGTATLLARGSEVTSGDVVLRSNTVGGNGGTGTTGAIDGNGGDALAIGNGAGLLATPHFITSGPVTVSLTSLIAQATALGGSSGSGSGGNANGGAARAELNQSTNPVTNTGSVSITGSVSVDASGTGGSSTSGLAGTGTGGSASVISVAGAMTLGGVVDSTARGTGGSTVTGTGGSGVGGLAESFIDGGQTDVSGTFTATASAFGATSSTGRGGDARGGVANVRFGTQGGVANLNGAVLLNASANAGRGGSLSGGDASGGTSLISSSGVSTLTLSRTLNLNVQARGGGSLTGGGGGLTGGSATVGSAAGLARYLGNVTVNASAVGSSAATSGSDAQGGTITVSTQVGASRFSGSLSLSTDATGGSASAGSGGRGRGGQNNILTQSAGNDLVAQGPVFSSASGTGGAGAGAGSIGGSGSGGTANVVAQAATLSLQNTLQLQALGTGGAGVSGGTGTGGRTAVAAINGAVGVAGTSTLVSTGRGGDALSGTGGSGGNGTGGSVSFGAASAAFDASVTGRAVTQDASGFGGTGGAGRAGGAGGRGGTGVGGSASSGSTSSAGTISIGVLSQNANGVGGAGGGGAGNVGGAGGPGAGGRTGVGTDANPSVLTGSFTWSSLFESAVGLGGDGGPGGSANGGAGGSGTGGLAALGGSGGSMNVPGVITLFATGTGGNGGGGTLTGAGGSGTGGIAEAGVHPHSVAGGTSSLTGGALTTRAGGNAGSGSTPGMTTAGQATVSAFSGSVSFASINLLANGSSLPTVVSPSGFLASGLGGSNGSITVTSNVTISSGGNATLGMESGTIQVGGALSLITDRSIITSLFGTRLIRPGSLTTGASIDLRAINGGIVNQGSLQAGALLDVSALGATMLGDLIAGGAIDVASNGALSVGNVTGGDVVHLTSQSPITAGNIRAEQNVKVDGSGMMLLGNISAGDGIKLASDNNQGPGGPIIAGTLDAGILRPSSNATAIYGVLVGGTGAVTFGQIDARGPIAILSRGGTITTSSISADQFVVLLAGGPVSTGALRTTATGATFIANESMAALVPNDPQVPADFATLLAATPLPVPGSMTISGPVNTGTIKAANTGSATVAGMLTATQSAYINAGVLALSGITAGTSVTLQAVTGDIAQTGTLRAGTLLSANALGTMSFGNLVTGSAIDLSSNNALTVGNVISGDSVRLVSLAPITAGDIRGEGGVRIDGGGNLRLGGVSAGDFIAISLNNGGIAGGTVVTGNLDAGILRPSIDPLARYGILADSTGTATLGTVTARGAIGVIARGGSIGSGAITGGQSVGLLAGGSVTTGSLRSGLANTTLIASDSMSSLVITGPNGPDYSALLVAAPVPLNGSIALGGAVDTGIFRAASTGGFTAQATLNAEQSVTISSRGLASLSGVVNAPTIIIGSADIAIGSSGGIGGPATTALTLNVDPSASAISVGGVAASGWSLDLTEVSRLRARRIVIAAGGTQPPLVRVGTFTLTGSAGNNPNLLGPDASFTISTPRSIEVSGPAAVANAGATDTLQLSAGQRIDVVTDLGGSLRLTDAAGGVAGLLDLTASDLLVADAALATQLGAGLTAANRNAAIAAPPSSATLAGFLGGGTIKVSSGNSVLIRNTGDPFYRAGFTAGPGGFRVTAQNGIAPVDVVINGRAFATDGTALRNERTIELVTLQAAASGRGFAATSTVNGCVVDGVCLVPTNSVAQTLANISITLEELTANDERKVEAAAAEAANALEKLPQVRIERLVNARAITDSPVVDEPITSGGNTSFWLNTPEAPRPAVVKPGKGR